MIGLISNYYIRNYGSVLQSYALFRVVSQEGKCCEVIQYHDVASLKQKIEILFKIKLKKLSCSYIVKYVHRKFEEKNDIEYKKLLRQRQKLFDNFNRIHLCFSEEYVSKQAIRTNAKRYNLILIGSDQLWGPEDLIRDYHTLNWVPDNICKASYATSFGVGELPNSLMSVVKEFVPHLKYVSVREESGAKIIESACRRKVQVTLDPTMLLTKEEWENILPEDNACKEDYIFCYFLGDNEEQRKIAKKLGKRLKCKIVAIKHPEFYEKKSMLIADEYVNVDPLGFINLIKNAKYVIGDSFHMTVFSLLFHKKFITFNRYKDNGISRNTRILNLLSRLKLSKYYMSEGTFEEIQRLLTEEFDYENADILLNKWRQESLQYLKEVLCEE